MSSPAVGTLPPTIKPDDMVRTPDGSTAICVELRPAGFRLIEYSATGQRSIWHHRDLYLVRSAPVRRWKSYSF